MKKYFVWAVLCMAVGMVFGSCSKDEEDPLTVERVLTGRYYILDGHKNTTYAFYKNHLVVCNGGTSVVSGMLAGGDSFFLGQWQLTGDRLTTTFTSGSYGGFDWNKILYGTLTDVHISDYSEQAIVCKDGHGTEHTLFNNQGKEFKDYTDDTAHDKAVQGMWNMQAYSNNKPINCTMEVKGDGTARFVIPELDIDFTTTYTTRNGHIAFESYLLPNSKDKNSFIYIREANDLEMFTEDNAVRVWSWNR